MQRYLEAALLLAMLGAACSCQAQIVPLAPVGLRNSELAQDADGDGVPDYWRARNTPPGAPMAWELADAEGPTGKPAIRATVPAGVRTELFQAFEARPGTGYSAGCRIHRETGRRAGCHVYLRWLDAQGKEIGRSDRRSHELPLEGWAELTCSGYAPDSAAKGALIIAVRATDAAEIRLSDAVAGEGLGPTPLMDNGGFEADDTPRAPADSWTCAARRTGVEVERDSSRVHTGGAAARLSVTEDAEVHAGVEQVTPPLKPFDAMRLSFWYAGTGGLSTGVVRFLDAREPAREYGRRYFKQDLPQRDWRQRTLEVATPAEARQADAIRVQVSLYQRKPGEVWYDDVKLEALVTWTPRIEPPISALQTRVRPADGAIVKQTPPDFSWTPQPQAVSYDLELARSPDFAQGSAATVEGLPYNCYSHHQVLEPGRWHWRYRYSLAEGEVSEWSAGISFVVAADAAEFPVPPLDELIGRAPTEHPRVLLNSESVAQVRERISSERGEWLARLRAESETLVGEELQAEPGEAWDFSRARGNVTPAMKLRRDRLYETVSATAEKLRRLALAYVLTDEDAFGVEASRRLLHLARWNPAGATSYRSHDRACRELMWTMALAYDWVFDLLSDQEKEQVRQAVALRAAVVHEDLSRREAPLYEWPYNSHGWSALGLLGLTAIALQHEVPDATEWLRFAASVHAPLWPPWGGEDGGWSQGINYWVRSMPTTLYWFEALRSATGLDMYQKAWARSNAWLAWYFHPPWCDRSHFGDGNTTAAGPVEALIMSRCAEARGRAKARPLQNDEGYFRWYADSVQAEPLEEALAGLWTGSAAQARPPVDVAQGTCLRGVGWVAMHQALYDPDEAFLLFKSSPYGSYNHSHADQNSFVLYAFGEPLAIDSGYYDRYDSPHDRSWARRTIAHNCILVDGEGQPIHDETAVGTITRWFTSADFDFATGDATDAYARRLKRFQRSILFVRPDYFVVFDDLRARSRAKYTWCLHALEPMALSPEDATVTIGRGKARLAVRFALPEQVAMKQDNAFTAAPVPSPERPNQWHAYIEPAETSEQQRFVAALLPYEEGAAPPPAVEAVNGQRCVGITVKGERPATHLFRTEAGGVCQSGAIAFNGAAASVIGDVGEPVAAFLVRGTTLTLGDRALIETEAPMTVAVRWTDTRLRCEVEGGGRLSLLVAEAPEALRLDGKQLAPDDHQYDEQAQALSLVLASGSHRIEAGAKADFQPAGQPSLAVELDGQPMPVELNLASAPDGTQVAWGELGLPAGPYIAAVRGMPEEGWLEVGQRRLGQAEEQCWLEPGSRVLLVGPQDREVRLLLTALLKQREAATLAEVGESMIEAEGALIRRRSQPASTQRWSTLGDARTWHLEVPAQGRYYLLVKAATYLEEAVRLVEIDGQPPRPRQVMHRFAGTGGIGARPEHWRHFGLADSRGDLVALPLAAGRHTITMTCLAGDLKVEYVALVPLAEGQPTLDTPGPTEPEGTEEPAQ